MKKLLQSMLCAFVTVTTLFTGNVTFANEETSVQLVNVAEKGVAEASQVTTQFEGLGPDKINDGIVALNSFWDSGNPKPDEEVYAIIDLQKEYDVQELRLYNYWDPIIGTDTQRWYKYEIYGSTDKSKWDMIAIKNNEEFVTSEGDYYKLETPKKARYIKVKCIDSNVDGITHIVELQVFAALDESEINIAYEKETRANYGKDTSNLAVDGNLETAWNSYTFPSNLDVDLGENYQLNDLTLYFPETDNRYYQYTVYTSLDGINFERLVQKRNHEVADADGDTYQITDTEARYIRVNVEYDSKGDKASLSEIEVHGIKSNTPTKEREELQIPAFEGSGYDTPITEEETINEVYALVERRLGSQYKDWFEFELADSINGEDFYEISNKDGKILIRGNKGVSITTGLNYYLKYFCKVQITQQTEQLDSMPETVVPVTDTIYKSTPLTVRYAYNYCTLSYTMAFYGEEEWQRELDWLALNGVNVILDTTGQEAVWIDFLQKIGYSTDDAEAWLVGPAYTAWQYMSNIENYGGPINDQYILDRLELARKNQRWMRTLGISPVLQGYTGMIPSDYESVVDDKEAYKDIIDAMMSQGGWGGHFNRPDMLKTNSEIFDKCADLFYESQEKVLGDVSSYYAADPFHEGGIPPKDMTDAEISSTVLEKMIEHDSEAVWMIQSWQSNPTEGLLEGLEGNRDHALILDLSATVEPHYNDSDWGEEFHETPWIYCMLDNFGDRPGVHGELEVIATKIVEARESTNHMKGIGICPEGTRLNPVNYELFFEMAWEENEVNVEEWLKDYVERRYGTYSESAYQGWLKLLDTAYGEDEWHWGAVNSIANYRPGVSPQLGGNSSIPYDTYLFNFGISQILEDYDILCENESYLYDVASFLQQQLQNSQLTYYNNFEKAYKEGNLEEFDKYSQLFLESISLVDEVVATQKDGLLGTWIGRAHDRSANYDDFSRDIFDFNAKALITTWGGRNCWFGDYAYRQYSGLENDYVKPRWEKYVASKREVLVNGTEYKEVTFSEYFNDMWDFILSNKVYTRETTDAKSELKRLAQVISEKYLVDGLKSVTDDNVAVNGFPSSDHGEVTGWFPIENAIDNDDSTIWVAGTYDLPSTFELDLGKKYEVYKIQTVFEKEPAAERNLFIGFRVEACVDGEWVQVLEDKTSKEVQSFDILFDTPENMSKVRVVVTSVDGSLGPAIAELRVYSSKGIQILDSESLVRKDDVLFMNQEDTVANIKSKLTADVGEIVFYSDGKEMNDDAVVTEGCEIKLIASGVVVDTLQTKINVNKYELNKVVEAMEQLNKDVYTTSSWSAFEKVLNTAKTLLEDENATQVAVDDAVKELQEAEKQLVVRATNEQLTSAKDKLNTDNELVESNYTSESWTAYQNAKKALEAAVANASDVSEFDFAGYLTAYDNARNGLQYKSADYSKVEEAIAKVPADLSIYTEESVKALNDALASVVEGKNITEQEEVDAMAKAIENAINGLVKKDTGKPEDPSEPTDPTTPVDPEDPTTPTDPETPSEPESPAEPEGPNTSDNYHVAVFTGLLVLSAGVLALVLLRRKREAK